jgi:hypothetical protein
MNTVATPAAQLRSFLAKYDAKTATQARRALTKVRALLPGATEMVYDNYNALVVGYGPSERASEAVLSLAVFPKWVTLCFLQNGPRIPDPEKLLSGSGNVVRSMRLASADDLDKPAVKRLIREAVRMADVPITRSAKGRMVIKSVSAKQRPRRQV